MLGPLHENEHSFEGTHPSPFKHETSTLPAKSQTFHTINIFSDSPEGFAFFRPLGSLLSSPDHAQHLF